MTNYLLEWTKGTLLERNYSKFKVLIPRGIVVWKRTLSQQGTNESKSLKYSDDLFISTIFYTHSISSLSFIKRFPGGESYKDLIHRLESVVVDLEQQVIPTLVVSHVSVLQMLIAYFRNSPVEEAMQIEVPLHTVLKFTPARGGGWQESCHELAPVYERSNSFCIQNKVSIEGMEEINKENSLESVTVSPSPIWGDHMRHTSSESLQKKEKKSIQMPI